MTCKRERGFAGRLRAVDLDDAAARQAADAERDVETERAGGDDFDRFVDLVAHAHDRALAELLFDLAECGSQRPALVVIHCLDLIDSVHAARLPRARLTD